MTDYRPPCRARLNGESDHRQDASVLVVIVAIPNFVLIYILANIYPEFVQVQDLYWTEYGHDTLA